VIKNTKTPKNFTVASNSLCNKSYLDLPPFSIIGGYPAKLIGRNKERVFEKLEGFSK
jgi:acetyltransferase-like isoleucine patch superfamily enzyme